MSDRERYGIRDLTYSSWHRTESIKRFIGQDKAYQLSYIDIDAVEYCRKCLQPLLLLELAKDVGQSNKNHAVLSRLAKISKIPAAVVLYMIDTNNNDILGFRVKNIWPKADTEWRYFTPAEFAARLWLIRDRHKCFGSH